jgi:hypothetical protein
VADLSAGFWVALLNASYNIAFSWRYNWRVSFLFCFAPGATAQQLRFGILANLPSVKVVSGESMLTSIRQGFSLAQRRAGAHGNHIRQHSIDGESAVLLTLEGRSHKKSGPLWRDRSRRLWGCVTADWDLVTAAESSRAS